jgi:tetratricopeptide (TPR) repeat protein
MTNDRFNIGIDCDNIAVCYSNMREFDRAIICEEKAIDIHQNDEYDLEALERDYAHFGSILTDGNKLDLAEENIKKALEFGERTENEKLLAIMYAQFGILMFKKGYIKDGFEYRKKAVDIIEHSPNDPSAATIYSNMGMAYYKIGLNDIAMEWFMKALNTEEQNYDTFGMAREYKNISKIFFESGNLEKALEYQNNALEKHTLLDDQLSINNDKRVIEAIRSAMDNIS